MPEFAKYVINLTDRKDRRAEMLKQLARIGWSAEFSDSVRPQIAGGFSSIGAHGCFRSHLDILRKGQTSGQNVIIMEDDLDFVPEFGAWWRQAVAELQSKSWSIFYPGHYLKGQPAGLSLLSPETTVMCTHFLVIEKNALGSLVNGLEIILSRPPGHPLGGPMHVDGAYSVIRAKNPKMHTYAFCPSLGYQRPSHSDISNTGFYDRIRTLRPIVRALRGLKRRFL